MASKKIKLLSGLLSFTAIASMTGAPVLANEFLQNPLSGSETQDEKEARKSLSILDENAEDAASGSISQFIEQEEAETSAETVEEETQKEEDGGQQLVVLSDTEAADENNVSDEQGAPEEIPSALDAVVDNYNQAVMPEVSIVSGRDSAVTGLLGIDLAADPVSAAQSLAIVVQKPEAADKKLVIASPNVYLNIHESPSLGSEIIGKMYGNDVAIELRRADDRWTRVRSGDIVGYVMSDYLVQGDQAQALSEIIGKQVATVDKGDKKEVYQEANDTSKVVTMVEEGEQYEVLQNEDGWLGILTEDGEGYIPSSDVTLSMAYPVAESSRDKKDRILNSNVKERADHELRKAEKADAVAELARTRADLASGQDEETATAVVQVALRAADAAAAQANVAKVAVSQAGEESGQAVIDFALQYVGNPYVWGGSSLTHGADCSGFVMAVYGNFGFRLPHYDVSDRSVGSPVSSLADARAGDIVCYNGHVALYMGDGRIVHAQDEHHGITTSNANFMHIVCIRRLFN